MAYTSCTAPLSNAAMSLWVTSCVYVWVSPILNGFFHAWKLHNRFYLFINSNFLIFVVIVKRILTIPLLFIYLIAASGVLIHLHYCGTQLDSWNIYADSSGCSDGECGDESEQNDDCCKDEVVSAKISQDQQVTSLFKLNVVPQDIDMPASYVHTIHDYNNCVANTLLYSPNAPPGLWQNIPIYILNSNFTYYG